MVRFLRLKDKLAVLDKAKILKGSDIFINEDFPEAVRQRRKELLSAIRVARERGDIAYLRYDKLIVHPPIQNPSSRKYTQDFKKPWFTVDLLKMLRKKNKLYRKYMVNPTPL